VAPPPIDAFITGNPLPEARTAAVTLDSFITGKPSPGGRFVAGADLTGIKPKAVEEIVRGLDAVLTPVGVKVDGITVGKIRGANAAYVQSTFTQKPFTSIQFTKGHTNKSMSVEDAERIYAANKARNVAALESRLADPNYPVALRAQQQARLDLARIPTRWTVGSTSGRPVFSTAAHEAGHAILPPMSRLNSEWKHAVRSVPQREWLRVSEYGAKNADELWAEITTLLALGREIEVPTELLRIYRTIHAKIGRTP
jgi:hypothetical protein